MTSAERRERVASLLPPFVARSSSQSRLSQIAQTRLFSIYSLRFIHSIHSSSVLIAHIYIMDPVERSPSPDAPHPSTAVPKDWSLEEYDEYFTFITDDDEERAVREEWTQRDRRKHREIMQAWNEQQKRRAARLQAERDAEFEKEAKHQNELRDKFYKKRVTELPAIQRGLGVSGIRSIAVPEAILAKLGKEAVPLAHFLPENMEAYRRKRRTAVSDAHVHVPVDNGDGTVTLEVRSKGDVSVPKVKEDEDLTYDDFQSAQPGLFEAMEQVGISQEHQQQWRQFFYNVGMRKEFFDPIDGKPLLAAYIAEFRRLYYQDAALGIFCDPAIFSEDIMAEVKSNYRARKARNAIQETKDELQAA